MRESVVALSSWLLRDLVNFWLYDPNSDGKKPNQKKLSCKIGKRHLALQFSSLKCFRYKVQAIENAEHRKQMQRNDYAN